MCPPRMFSALQGFFLGLVRAVPHFRPHLHFSIGVNTEENCLYNAKQTHTTLSQANRVF